MDFGGEGTHACAHVGAVQVPVFSGFAAPAVRQRLEASEAKVAICASGSFRRGRWSSMREVVDEAAAGLDVAVLEWDRRSAQWPELVQIGVAAIGVATLVGLYLHLREATHYRRRMSFALAGAATLVIGAVAWIIAIGVDDGDVNRVDLGPEVRLGAARVVPNRDISDYLAEVDELRLAAARERQKSLLNAPLADADE